MKTFLIGLIFLICTVASSAYCQDSGYAGESILGFQWNRNSKSIEIPFELHSNLVIVPLRINNSDTLRFIVDSGLVATLLTDTSVVHKLGLKSIRTVDLNGLGINKPLKAHVVINTKIQIGEAFSLHQNLIYISDDLLNLSNSIGTKVHGIIGYELFASLVVTIDYKRLRIVLTEPRKFKVKKRQGILFPAVIDEGKPYIQSARLNGKLGEMTNRLLLDTGGGHVLLLEGSSSDSLQFTLSKQRFNLGIGLNGPIIGRWGRVTSLQIGPWKWLQLPTTFPDSVARPSATILQGSLGGEFFRRFVVTFDYLGQQVFLKPIRNPMRKNFEYGFSELGLRTIGSSYQRFVIETVNEGSPADEAGILPGDEIWSINDKRANTYRLGEMYRILRKQTGEKIKLLIRRDLEFIFFEFQPRKLF
jgi:hypothetical protein